MEISEIIKAYGGILPSRGELRRTALFGTDEQRATANMILRLLPKADLSKEDWIDSGWSWTLTPEELSQSPEGRFIAENCVPDPNKSDDIAKRDLISTPEPPATKEPDASPTEQSIPPLQPPPGPSDDLGERMEQERAAKRERERTDPPWKWSELKPSKPDTGPRPIADSDFDNNKPLY